MQERPEKHLVSHTTKVLYMITKGVWGGAQKYVYSLATGLPKDHCETVVLCGEGAALPEKLEARGIRVFSVPTLMRDISLSHEIRSFFTLVNIIRKEKPDVLHLNSTKIGGMGALAGRVAGVKKIIYTAHGWAFNEDRSPVSKLLIIFLSWVTIQLCHQTIVIAKREYDQALRMPLVNKSKITFIKNGIEKIEFLDKTEARTKLLEKIQKDMVHKTLWFGTIAELHPNKGLEYSIAALARITEPFVYFIIGGGEEKENLKALILKHNLEHKVFLVGFVADAHTYLKAFDVFLLTSLKEGLPYAVLEAGQAGLPVIASKVGGIPDIIENGTSGILTTVRNTSEITRAIEYMLENPEDRKRFGKHLKEKVAKEFSEKSMVEKTTDLYFS